MTTHTAQAHTACTTHAGTRLPGVLTVITGTDPLDFAVGVGCIDTVQSVPVVRLTGELDLLTGPALLRLLRSAVAIPATAVVVDTSAVTFIDCAGLRPLLQAAADLRRRRALLLMLRPSAAVLRLTALTGTRDLLDLTCADLPAPA